MRKILLVTVILLFIAANSFAQSPNAIPYQAVIRNSSGVLVANQSVKIRLSVRDSATTGTVVYRETHTATTTTLGMINLMVGQGTAGTGSFSGINWGNNNKFLQMEVDVTGGTSFIDMGTQQLMSVPYALYASNAKAADTALVAKSIFPAANNADGDTAYWKVNASGINYNAGKVGIGSSTPSAQLHVSDSSVLFTGPQSVPFSTTFTPPPASGSGGRMMWYPQKLAFRAGYAVSDYWDKDSIGVASFASGSGTLASGFASTAMGLLSVARGGYSTALGSSFALGDYSTSMGVGIASGFASTAMGYGSYASGGFSTAMGEFTKSKSYAGLVIGSYNDSTNAADASNFNALNRIFQIGNGTADNVRSNAITVLQNGNTGLGTTNPITRLHVADSSVLFTGPATVSSSTTYGPPASGAGTRMMWYPQKGAFRVGSVDGTQWNKDSIGSFSFAAGFNTKALGYRSTAIGGNTSATGSYATAMGYYTDASGIYSTAMGYFTNASGLYSTAMGNGTNASGSYSTAMGNGTNASGLYSTAMGFFTDASGIGATAMGYYTTASGWFSTALGSETKSKSYAGTVVGIYNDSTNAASATVRNSLNRIFEIGNGTADNARSNAMTVLQNGKIGIGNVSPTIGQFEIKSGINAPQLVIVQSGNDYSRINMRNTNTAATNRYWDIAAYNDATSVANDKFNIWCNTVGDILSIRGNGNAVLLGTLTQSSDARLKTNIHPLGSTLKNVLQIKGYSYNWIDEKRDQNLQYGVLAQELQKIYPELVSTDDKGTLSVNYIGLIPVMLESIKDLKAEIDQYKAFTREMSKQLKDIQETLQSQKK